MFYSQFILAKKGPLGTIWIAAHLERKLRKNQVADTDIGVSVDSILSPDVPIALRLSSHLLLGVVRIYNRKVNYLFDDCSEALLKVKQAFRSTAVDLPPEESKAPYHSITLPETFDLDDFELPDNDILQGNYVDHHISSREQITLQDTMEGVSYSTSKFGLDERFGDADAPGLDLDEELFLDNIGTSGHADESADPQASVRSMSPLKQDDHAEDRAANSETMVDDVDEDADLMDYAQAPRTPGLVEEPNFSNVQEASACDDHLESDYHLASTMKENTKEMSYEDKQEVDWCSHDDRVSDVVPERLLEGNVYQAVVLDIKESKPQGESSIEANIEFASLKEPPSVSEPGVNLLGQVESMNTASELADDIIETSDVPCREDLLNGPINEDKNYVLSADEAHDDHQGHNDTVVEKNPETSGLAGAFQQVSEDVSAKDVSSLAIKVSGDVGRTSTEQKSCPDAAEVASENHVESFQENPETQYCHDTIDSSALNLNSHEKDGSNETPFLRACNSTLQQSDVTKSGYSMSTDVDIQSDIAILASSGGEETKMLGNVSCTIGNSEQNSKENQVREPASAVLYHSAASESDGLVNSTNLKDKLMGNVNYSVEAELPAPEKLLAVPEGNMDQHSNILVEVSPINFDGLVEGDAGSKTIAGKKRSYTESTLTEQSLNSVESSRLVRVKRTIESVPDDNDLLSSILVGRRSSVLKVKPTPLSEATSMKRTRSAPRSGAPKRKVLMDETMVLHGDKIRQQLTNTEDIRRVRKKAPCTRPEISMIQKQHLEDEIFLQPVLTGMSIELSSLHNQVYDLSRITVCLNDVTGPSLELAAEPRLASQDDENGVFLETMDEPKLASHYENNDASHYENNDASHYENNNVSLETVSEPRLTSHNIESGNGSDKNVVMEQSEMRPNSELLPARDNEITEPSENLLLNENRLEEVDSTIVEVNISQEQIKPSNDNDASQEEPLLDVAEAEKSELNVHDINPALIAEVESLGSFGHATGDVGDTSAVFPYEKTDLPSVGLDSVDVDEGQTIDRDEAAQKDGDVYGVETELGRGDAILSDVARDSAADELVPNSELKNDQNETYNIAPEEQHLVEFGFPAQVSMLEDASLINGENADNPHAYQPSLMDAEFPGFDLHERDELNYSATGNDTEFLNVDDDELTEMADDYMPDDEEKQFTENTGWSSRTRAVSKYLQTAFAKEAEYGRRSLSTNNLLIGKSRKEASRMFFETLVLKTRDYIHVEQRNPYDDIILKPRTKLMKSDF